MLGCEKPLLEVLGKRVRICSLPGRPRQLLCYLLCAHCCHWTRDDFFAVTHADGDITLLLEDEFAREHLAQLEAGAAELAPIVWRPIALELSGDSGDQVQRVAEPLATAGISILNLSTFAGEYVMVSQEDLQRAVAVLQPDFHIEFAQQELDVKEEQQAKHGEQAGTPSQQEAADDAEVADVVEVAEVAEVAEDAEDADTSRPLQIFDQSSLLLAEIRVDSDASVLLVPLLKCLVFSEPENCTGYYRVRDRASILAKDTQLAGFPASSLNVDGGGEWCALKVDDGPLGFAEPGIVAKLCLPLKGHGLDILSVSCYETDYLLFRADDLSTIKALLQPVFPKLKTSSGGVVSQ